MNGKAPNWFVTGFHSPLTRKPRPKVRKLGAALTVSTIAMRPRSARTATPAAPEPARKRVSPQDDPVGWSRARRAPRRNGKAMGASTRERGRPLKVLAIERDHVDRRSVLRDHGGRQRRVRERRRRRLSGTDRPPQERDEGLGLLLGHPVRIHVQFLIDQDVCERRDRIASGPGRVGNRHVGPVAVAGRKTSRRARCGGRRRVQIRQDVVPLGVLDLRVAHAVLYDVGELHVADRAGLPFHRVCDSLVLRRPAPQLPSYKLYFTHLVRDMTDYVRPSYTD